MSETGQNKQPKGRRGLGYNTFKEYLRFINNLLYYSKEYYLNRENIPDDGVPLMVVCNHQNGFNDALNLLFSIRNRNRRKMRFIARGDVFKPIFVKALEWLGIYPAYRKAFDGGESLGKNYATFSRAADELVNGGTVAIYPEAGHQDKHWLGKFSLGYLRIVFEAAEKTDFEKEIYIIPACNHYSDYYHMRKQMLIKFGEPLAIAPFYETYKENPRLAQQQVSDILRSRIHDMMLSIDDIENYEAINYIRDNQYGKRYAVRHGFKVSRLPDKLDSDKQLVARLADAKAKDEAGVQKIYDDTAVLVEKVKEYGIQDDYFDRKMTGFNIFYHLLLHIILFPVFIFTAIPNVIVYYAPRIMTSKLRDRMLHSGFDLGMTSIISAPICYLLTFIIAGAISGMWWWALLWLVLMPVGFFFFWAYKGWFKKLKAKMRYRRLRRRGELAELTSLRSDIYSSLDKILGEKK